MSKQKNTQAKAKTKIKPLMQQEVKKTAGWKPYLVLTILTFMLYSNTLNHQFAFDDGMVITHNKFTQQGIKGIPNIFKYDTFVGSFMSLHKEKTADQVHEEMKTVAGGRYRPLSLVTFALEVQFFGKKCVQPNSDYEFKGNAFVSHLNNILLYLLTTCLLFLILYRLFPPEKEKKWYLSFPFIVTILFLAHPIHTETVANIKGRDEIMTLLGALCAMWFTIKYFDTNKNYNLLLSGLCLFLGLLSKENAITFLAVIPLTIYYFVDRKIGRIFKSMIPLIAASALFLLIRASVLGINSNTSTAITELLNNPFVNATFAETKATIFYTLLLYVKLLFFPHPLTYDYYPHHIEIVGWTNPVAILSLLFYLGITIYAGYVLFKNLRVQEFKGSKVQGFESSKIISYAIWFYLLPLTIVSNLFFPIGVFMGERFVFISSIGFCIFLGWLIYHYLPKIPKNSKNSIYLICFVMVIILGLYSTKTISRNKAWKDDFTLYSTDIKTSKKSAKGNYALGRVLYFKAIHPNNEKEKQKLSKEAIQYLQHAIELYPKYPDAYNLIGYLYAYSYDDTAKALHYYTKELQRGNAEKTVYDAVKILLQKIRRSTVLKENQVSSNLNEIIQLCDELLTVKPDCWEAYQIKGLIYSIYFDDDELSLLNLEKAAAIDAEKTPDFFKDIGSTYVFAGNYKKAVPYLLKAIELDSDSYVTYMHLGAAYQRLGDFDKGNLYITKGNEIKKQREKK